MGDRARLVVGLTLLAGILTGCFERENPQLNAHPAAGTYRKLCRRCHGNWGDGGRASRIAKRPHDLGSAAFRDTMSLEQVLHVVLEGKGRMEGYRDKLSEEEAMAVARLVLDFPGREVER